MGQISVQLGVSKSAVLARLRRHRLFTGARKRPGYLSGTVPFGWKKEHGRLVPHQAEQRTIQTIQAMRSRGRSLRDIAALLNEEGVVSKNGDRWHAETVRRALICPQLSQPHKQEMNDAIVQ